MSSVPVQPLAEPVNEPPDVSTSPASAVPRGGARRWLTFSLPGAWVAVIVACLSFTPSLLPRSGVVQGVLAGLTGAIGYGLGVAGAWVWREFADRGPRAPRSQSWRVFAVAGPLLLLVAVILGQRWQQQIRELMGVEWGGPVQLVIMPIAAVVVFALLLAIGRGLRWCYRALSSLLGRWIGRGAARVVGWAAVALGLIFLVNGVLLQGAVQAADSAFSLRNGITPEGIEQPTSDARSGSTASIISWDSLGREGRKFVATGPTEQEIAEFNGSGASEPIRVFAGLESADDTEERALLAVDDLERAGGFDRSYLLVATTTGSGWLDPSAVDSFEYITGGDSAIVAIQYSYLPSWISFLVDQERAREAGRTLYDAVYERWSQLAPGDRPRLIVFGESLGSFGGEAAFSGEYDIRNRTDGTLFAGPPASNRLHTEFTSDRDPGSTQVEPVYRDGRTVRWATDVRTGIPPEDAPWTGTRVLYLQNPSDPIVWWHPDLVLSKPSWIDDPASGDVLEEMVWIPFVSFWQVTADLPLAGGVPPGHGHNYTGEHGDGWAAILRPDGWSQSKADELRELMVEQAEAAD